MKDYVKRAQKTWRDKNKEKHNAYHLEMYHKNKVFDKRMIEFKKFCRFVGLL